MCPEREVYLTWILDLKLFKHIPWMLLVSDASYQLLHVIVLEML